MPNVKSRRDPQVGDLLLIPEITPEPIKLDWYDPFMHAWMGTYRPQGQIFVSFTKAISDKWLRNWPDKWSYKTDPTDKKQANCSHIWRKYTGFTETYKYCVSCDLKDKS